MSGTAVLILTLWSLLTGPACCHVEITYPGWRGNNLIVNETFPYGMQWVYPCGGLSPTQNRSAWPLTGGAIAMQPGRFAGHKTALMYVNLGLGEDPQNYSMPMVSMFQITGPTDDPYPGTICLPQVPLPAGVTPKPGDLASIQVVQATKHGAALYSCADIIFTDDMSQVPELSPKNCFNSTTVQVDNVKVVTNSDMCSSSTTSAMSATASRTDLFPASTTTGNPSDGASKHVSRFSALLSFLLLV